MQPYQEGGEWFIARNFREVGGDGIHGSRSRIAGRTRTVYEAWTGERWWHQRSTAMKFPTQEAAQTYLEQNWLLLEQAP